MLLCPFLKLKSSYPNLLYYSIILCLCSTEESKRNWFGILKWRISNCSFFIFEWTFPSGCDWSQMINQDSSTTSPWNLAGLQSRLVYFVNQTRHYLQSCLLTANFSWLFVPLSPAAEGLAMNYKQLFHLSLISTQTDCSQRVCVYRTMTAVTAAWSTSGAPSWKPVSSARSQELMELKRISMSSVSFRFCLTLFISNR